MREKGQILTGLSGYRFTNISDPSVWRTRSRAICTYDSGGRHSVFIMILVELRDLSWSGCRLHQRGSSCPLHCGNRSALSLALSISIGLSGCLYPNISDPSVRWMRSRVLCTFIRVIVHCL